MKSTVLTRITGAALFAALAMQAQIMAQQEHKREHFSHYRVKDLGTLAGGTLSQAFGMNNRGHVGGAATVSNGNLHAFLWTKHTGMQDLGTLGGPNSEAGPVNQSDEVAILSETFHKDLNNEDFCGFGTHLQCLGAIWENGVLTSLPTLAGPNANAQAYDLNNRGQVVGLSEIERKDKKGCLTPFQVFDFEAVIWEPNGEIRELPPLRSKGDTVGFAFGINEHGQAVGTSGLCSNTSVPPSPPTNAPHAVLWESDGSPKDLGTLGGTMGNVATSINNRGEVVGTSQSKDGTLHPFLWTKETGIQDLGAFPGAVATVAPCCNTINNKGEVVGFSIDAHSSFRALVWHDKRPIDLNRLIPKGSPWYLQAAESINDAGEITGYGTIQGETHAFLAIPCHRHGDRECCEDHDR
jgi:probable HAF family extracellular repeat protein